MWGWKAVERLVEPSIPFDRAKVVLQQHGFRLHASHPGLAVFKRSGEENMWTTPAPEARDIALELAVAPSQSGLYVQLRYGTFVLFDTGDLAQFADAIAELLVPDQSPTPPSATGDWFAPAPSESSAPTSDSSIR
jgi:hypothetical protein